MPTVLIDDHLLRDVLTGARGSDLGGLATSLATTGLWLFRLNSSWADPLVEGKLSLPVRNLSAERQTRFLERLTALPEEIEVLPLRQLARSMATLQRRHRSQGRPLSTAMVEALAAAHFLKSAIAVSQNDVGPHLRAAAEFDGIGFHIL